MHQSGPDTTRAGVDAADGALNEGTDRLKVGIRTFFGSVVGMADVEAHQPLLFAIKATSGHESSENPENEGRG